MADKKTKAKPGMSLRYNEGKLKWSLIHYESMEPMVRVLEFGLKKYKIDNWKIGLDKKENLESMMRHLTRIMDGEEIDPDSGLPHMGHIQCGAMFHNFFNHPKEKKTVKKKRNAK